MNSLDRIEFIEDCAVWNYPMKDGSLTISRVYSEFINLDSVDMSFLSVLKEKNIEFEFDSVDKNKINFRLQEEDFDHFYSLDYKKL